LSIQALLSPNSQNPPLVSTQSAIVPKDNDTTAVASPNDESKKALALEQGKSSFFRSCHESQLNLSPALCIVDPSIVAPYIKMLNSLNSLPDQPSPFPDATVFIDRALKGAAKDQVSFQQPANPSQQSGANMSESEILGLTDSSLLHIARSLIREKLPPSLYTPQPGAWNTSMEQEQKNSSLRHRNHSDASTLVDDGNNESTISRPAWRDTFTPSELYILYRALMFACHPSGSKAFFDGKRISELSPSQKAVYEKWAAYEGRDKRVSFVHQVAIPES
jgi:hypothetical protein